MTLPPEDLMNVLENMHSWEKLRGRRVFITGASGFVGRWLTESFEFANSALGLQSQLVKVAGDSLPAGKFGLGIHAAKADTYSSDMMATKRSLDFAVQSGVSRILFMSSGAVYGNLPAGMTHVSEDFSGAADHLAAYAESKRDGEALCARYAKEFGFCSIIARLFTFSGPALPLSANFAIGNFIRDVIAGGPIVIQGDGTAVRSYLYAADLAVWLWTLLLEGQNCRPYNVGSPEGVSISKLALAVVANTNPNAEIVIKGGDCCTVYVPSVHRAWAEHKLKPLIALDEGIRRMYAWNICPKVGETKLA